VVLVVGKAEVGKAKVGKAEVGKAKVEVVMGESKPPTQDEVVQSAYF
jgi:hypothetical protein